MDTADIINQMINDVLNGENVSAQDKFEDLISVKVTSALDNRKQELAQSVYRGSEDA